MKTTIFNTPILTPLLRLISRAILRLIGWHIEGQLPGLSKFIIIAAPHTSNWDFILFLVAGFVLKGNFHYLGKAELFRSPIGFFFYWCGGIPVDRGKSVGLVEQTVKVIQDAHEFVLIIAPQGTRGQVDKWKTGFYHIAYGAQIPIVMAYVHAPRKVVAVGDTFTPSGDVEADMNSIQTYYSQFEGVNKRKA